MAVVVVAVVSVCPTGARAQKGVQLPRPGQVGIAVQGGYGTLLDQGTIGKVFGAGPSFTVRLRYRMRYERALGLSFENHSLEARETFPYDPTDPLNATPTELSLILSGGEFYQLFGTKTPTTKMLMVGAGLAQYRAELNSGETEVSGDNSGDGLYVSLGAGLERFFFQSFAFDLSTRYFALFKDGEVNHDIQGALGVIFYAGY